MRLLVSSEAIRVRNWQRASRQMMLPLTTASQPRFFWSGLKMLGGAGGRRNSTFKEWKCVKKPMHALAPLFGRTLIIVTHPDDEAVTCAALMQRMREPYVFHSGLARITR